MKRNVIKYYAFILLSYLFFFDGKAEHLPDLKPSRYGSEVKQTQFLQQTIPELKLNSYLFKKQELLNKANRALSFIEISSCENWIRIGNPHREGYILSKEMGVYKKNRDTLKEALCWELSILVGCDQFFAPSLPVMIGNSLATYQPYIAIDKMYIPHLRKGHISGFKMSQEDFWILSLFIFLIGHSDLNGGNICRGINKQPILIDNDSIFVENDQIQLGANSRLYVPITNSLIDLDLGYVPLDEKAAWNIERFQKKLISIQDSIEKFFEISPLSSCLSRGSKKSFWARFEAITSFPPLPGMTLVDFSCTIFPDYYKNAQELMQLLNNEMGFEPGPATSFYLVGPFFPYLRLPSQNSKERIILWIRQNYGL